MVTILKSRLQCLPNKNINLDFNRTYMSFKFSENLYVTQGMQGAQGANFFRRIEKC